MQLRDGNTERSPAPLAFPVRHFCDRRQDLLGLLVTEQAKPVFDRISLGIERQLVDGRFARELGIARADTTPCRKPRTALLMNMVSHPVGDAVIRNLRSGHNKNILATGFLQPVRVGVTDGGFADDAMFPADHLAVFIHADIDPVRGHGPHTARRKIVFTAVDDLHRCTTAHDLGQQHRIDHEVRLCTPAEATANKLRIHLYVGRAGFQYLGRYQLRNRRTLGRRPDLSRFPVRADERSRVHRFHLGMVVMFAGIFERLHRCSACYAGRNIPLTFPGNTLAGRICSDLQVIPTPLPLPS